MRKLHENQKSAQRQNSSKRLKDFIMLKMGRNSSAGCAAFRRLRRALVLSQHRGECVEWPLNPVASLAANRRDERECEKSAKEKKKNV